MSIRKEFRRKAVRPYQHRKHILDLPILEKLYKIRKTHLLLVLLILFFFLFHRKYFYFSLLTLGSAVFSFYHSKFNRSPMDFKLALFLGVFITRYYGIPLTIIFFILSDIVPALLGGESVNGPDFFFFGWYFIINSLVLFFPSVSLVVLGPIVVFIHDLGAIVINNKIGGIPGFMSLFLSFFTTMVRIVYFLTLGGILEFLMQTI
ncbi:MAG: hypothetical protein ABIJ34_04980 [archaeon]